MTEGVLIVDKPAGPSSHDVVAQARRRFGTRRVGHAGTLDPLASGVLVLLFGEATKLSDVATREDKRYVTVVRFGRATDSHDAAGRTTSERELAPGWLDLPALERALDVERQREQQLPPAVSAIKVAGARAYRLARAGEAPALEPRPVQVRSLRLLGWSAEHAELELSVTKGYYVRALARDLASTLGVPAHLTRLRRTRSGCFDVAEACPWPPPPGVEPQPLKQVLPRLMPTWCLTDAGVARARQGKTLSAADFLGPLAPAGAEGPLASEALAPEMAPGRGPSAGAGAAPEATPRGTHAWTDASGEPVALGRLDGDGFRVQRGFVAPQNARSPSTSR